MNLITWLVQTAFWLGCCTPGTSRWCSVGLWLYPRRGLQPLLRVPFPHNEFCKGCVSPTLFCPLALGAQGQGARMPHFHLKAPTENKPGHHSQGAGDGAGPRRCPVPSSSCAEQGGHFASALPAAGAGVSLENLLPGQVPQRGLSGWGNSNTYSKLQQRSIRLSLSRKILKVGNKWKTEIQTDELSDGQG